MMTFIAEGAKVKLKNPENDQKLWRLYKSVIINGHFFCVSSLVSY